MEVREIKNIEDMAKLYDILRHMYSNLSYEDYLIMLNEMVNKGYAMMGVFISDGSCIACLGYWIGYRLYSGKFIQIDNLLVTEQYRNKKAGNILVSRIKEIAKENNCNRIILDSYVENFSAHKFFYREGFVIRGYHFNYIV